MKKVLIILFLFINSLASAKTYYVAPPTATPPGKDSNDGKKDAPWATWGKAFNDSRILPGDTVYFRGGVYYKAWGEGDYYHVDGKSYKISRGGTPDNYVHYFAYPPDWAIGSKPILDCDNLDLTGVTSNSAIRSSANYCHLKGLTIRNVWQSEDVEYPENSRAFYIGGTNTIFEQCVAHDIHGTGFWARWSNEFYYINCDAYNCNDIHTPIMPGNDGYGFMTYNKDEPTVLPSTHYYINCRAWNCADDGFQTVNNGYTEYDGCWSFHNGALEGAGNGFKLGLSDLGSSNLQRLMKNCLAAYNRASGITTNDKNKPAKYLNVYNNIIYRSYNWNKVGWPYEAYCIMIEETSTPGDEANRIYRNNIVYDCEAGFFWLGEGAVYTHSNNSWDSNPSVNVNSADFASLPATDAEGFALLSAPRKPDGSLPDLGDYFQLASDSDLIDRGMIIPGFHCATAGAHPGEDCVEWYGSAPDLGAFETNY